MIRRHGRDGPQPDLVLRHLAVFPPGRRLLFEEGRGRGGPSRQAGRAPEREHLAWPGRGCPGIASRQAGRGGRLREASSGPCDRDEDSARAPARRTARASPGLRHHLLGPEVGVAGGASADGEAPARRPRGHSRAQCGGARDARLDRGDTAGDPGLGPRHRQAAAGEGALDGGRAVPPHRKPQPRSAAPHSCGDRQHDPGRGGAVEERGADAASPQREADRGVLPRPAGAAADSEGLFDRAGDGGPAAELRACGLRPGAAGSVLDAQARDPGLRGRQGLGPRRGGDAGGDAGDAQAEGGAGAGAAAAAMAGPRTGVGPGHGAHGGTLRAADRAAGGPVGAGDRPALHAAAGGTAIGLLRARSRGAGSRPFAGPAFDRGDPGGGRLAGSRRAPDRGRAAARRSGLRHRPRAEGGTLRRSP